MKHPLLILLRHGQSQWNKENLFTGWVDIPLSTEGIQEAFAAGDKIADIPIDVIFISSLIRSNLTAMLVMSRHRGGRIPVVLHPGEGKLDKWAKVYDSKTRAKCIPVTSAWQLNERMYGRLQGLNKREMMDKFGEEQVRIWRRSFDVAPPNGESLKDTAKRAIPYFEKKIMPYLKKGKNVFVSAHGNSLRAIMMKLDGMSKEEIIKFELPTGLPVIYQYREGKLIKQT
ncbi:MAG: 2,3-bisphosphoglycerate-dependent phosphoglycerate mutase [Chlamydiae bacterium]|nr:2,3-bisphosphoglycerate-dependent phosphoglycerate mutase [Chlamydiota bacterium]